MEVVLHLILRREGAMACSLGRRAAAALEGHRLTLIVSLILAILLLLNISILVRLLSVRSKHIQDHDLDDVEAAPPDTSTSTNLGPGVLPSHNVSDVGKDQRLVILIVGTFARTGSTFVGELFEFNPSFTYL